MMRIILLHLLPSFLLLHSVSSDCIPPSDPRIISWWPADNQRFDLVGGNDAFCYEDPFPELNDKYNLPNAQAVECSYSEDAFYFNGEEDPKAKVIKINSTDFNFNPSDSFAVALRVNPRRHEFYQALVVKGPNKYSYWDWGLYERHGNVLTGPPNHGHDAPLTIDDWNHVVYTYNSGEAKVYMDGEHKSSSSDAIKNHPNTGLGFGTKSLTHANYLQGLMKDVVIFKGGLSDKDIMDLYNDGICQHSDGSVHGYGWFKSEAGSYKADTDSKGSASFRIGYQDFKVQYRDNDSAPTGNVLLVLSEEMWMESTRKSLEWMVNDGDKVEIKGRATIYNWNGSVVGTVNGHHFRLWASKDPDTFGIKIWSKNPSSGEESVLYENDHDQEFDADESDLTIENNRRGNLRA